MRRQLIPALALFVLPAIAFGACSDDEPSLISLLGEGCLLNSDCETGLVCVFERCHIECNDSTDCPVDEEGERLRCVIGEKPEHVCQLADESKCAYHSECPGLQICGPDGRCRDQCQDDRDCVSGQICADQGACAEPGEVDEEGELTGEVPPPDQQTGFPCTYDSQCEDANNDPDHPDLVYVCRNGGCNVACYDDVDCEPGFFCDPQDADASTPGNCLSLQEQFACIPGEQRACPCFPNNDPGFQVCDDGFSYGSCTDMSGQSCAAPG